MTETEKTVIATAKIHRMLKEELKGTARVAKDSAEVLRKYINELIAELAQKSYKYTCAGSRATVSEKDMLSAIKDKNPNFEYEIKD